MRLAPPLPAAGAIVQLRQRSWLVTEVQPGTAYTSGLVALAGLDDDAAGERLRVLWDHELDAEVVPHTPELLRPGFDLDPPALFGAYLNALRWNTVTSTDPRLLQSPFRAGIDLKPYQLEPLRKALELPRVNLFIADDVGLGKTIEAGLVMQELVLRQRIDRILVIAPPAVTLQWQEEMAQRFGLSFAIYDRDFISARRRERGFGVNPWLTHPRFIVSYALLRGSRGRTGGTQHLELLLSALGEGPQGKAPRTLLVLDECHQVAPSGSGLYPVDSRTTRAVRQIAERVGHRLFLSATPHNGHSQSFSSLLHLLDPQRFTRGVPVKSADELAPIMVRRLKRHLREHVGGLPERLLIDHPIRLDPSSPEVQLGERLAEYDALYRACLAHLPERQRLARSLVVVNLHKRLLSSIPAFYHTLLLHHQGAASVQTTVGLRELPFPVRRDPDDDQTETERDTAEDTFIAEASVDAGARAKALRDEMLAIAASARNRPDPRVEALAAWINRELCPTGRYNHRRLVVFTEYEDTLNHILRVLPPLLLDRRPDAIERFTGRLGEDERQRLKSAFNRPPDAHPLRILLCTDAAREGINLQAHCADLFHFDLPWNPSRIEQRNGRIDRVLQPEAQVRCHYFDSPDRPEDRVLTYLVRKLAVIREELGSLSAVVSQRLADRLEMGLRESDGTLLTPPALDRLLDPGEAARAAQRELEGRGSELLQGDLGVLERQLERSQRRLEYRWEHLRELVDLGLRAVAGQGLVGPHAGPPGAPEVWTLPPLDPSWNPILDLMREPEPERPAEPRRRGAIRPTPPLRPIAFRAAHRLDAPAVQLHLGHPFVKRLLARFRAQGTARHDLSRITLIENERDTSRRLVLFARLSLFGPGATRLHEELVVLTAQLRDGTPEPFAFGGAGEVTTLERLSEALAHAPRPHPSASVRAQVLLRSTADFRSLWPTLATRATEAAARARTLLGERAARESTALADLLRRQRQSIEHQFDYYRQTTLQFSANEADQRDQFDRDRRFLERRLTDIETELETEPAAIAAGYAVTLERIEPVGMAWFWPSSG